jgi:hypothetical protein
MFLVGKKRDILGAGSRSSGSFVAIVVVSWAAVLGFRGLGLGFGLRSPSTVDATAARFLGFFLIAVSPVLSSNEPLRRGANCFVVLSSSTCGAKCSERTRLPTVANPRIASGGMEAFREPVPDAPEVFFCGLTEVESVGSADAGIATRRGEGRGLPLSGDDGAYKSCAGGDEERTTMSKEVPAILSRGRSVWAATATDLAAAAHVSS